MNRQEKARDQKRDVQEVLGQQEGIFLRGVLLREVADGEENAQP